MYQLTFSRNANKKLKEDYDLLNEKFKKEKIILEQMVSDTNSKIIG